MPIIDYIIRASIVGMAVLSALTGLIDVLS